MERLLTLVETQGEEGRTKVEMQVDGSLLARSDTLGEEGLLKALRSALTLTRSTLAASAQQAAGSQVAASDDPRVMVLEAGPEGDEGFTVKVLWGRTWQGAQSGDAFKHALQVVKATEDRLHS